nr:FtsK/SpoIIIE domain-containing protein [Geodermatophilus sabuli]
MELHVVGGPAAGSTLPLERGRHVVGRGATATLRLTDPDVSRRHVLLEVGAGDLTVTDLGSTNGTVLAGEPLHDRPRPWRAHEVLRLGASALRTTGPGDAPAVVEPTTGGRVRLRPQPRLGPSRPAVEVALPGGPPAPPRRRLAWVAVVLPAIAGVTFAWVLDAPHFLFFALLSPVVAVGTWLSDRWSGRRSGRRAAAAHAAAVADARCLLDEAVAADVRAAEAAQPDLAALATAARRRSASLWQRGRGDADALAVRVGAGPDTSRVVAVHPDGRRVPEPVDHLPVVVELAATGGLGVVGPRSHALGVLAGVVTQLTALHAPGEVDLVLLTTRERLRDWAWLRWLPHLAPSSVHVRTDGTVDDAAGSAPSEWSTSLVSRRQAGTPGSAGSGGGGGAPGWVVVVVDQPLGSRSAAALRQARAVGVVVLMTAPAVAALPLAVDAVLELTGETGSAGTLRRSGAADRTGLVVDRVPPQVAGCFARDLAPLAPATTGTSLPRRVRLLDLGRDGVDVAADGSTSGSWSRDRTTLRTTLGRGTGGPVTVDLCRQGPHALVAGTTGSGKSELLQTLIAGLALSHPPDRCSFLLIDYKGGAAFAEAAGLPHTVGLLTDLDGATTARALRSLTAELIRRETLLAVHGAPDLGSLPDGVALSRLVIVVDEFAGLAEELPSFVAGLVGIAQRGRSLGVHLVLATQRPSGVVSPEIRANCTLRICLRTTDDADSRDVLGTPHAALLPVDVPGRAYLRAGAGPPVLFQVARVATVASDHPGTATRARPWRWPEPPDDGAAVEVSHGDSDLARLVSALRRVASRSNVEPPHRPWCPVLPDVVRAERLGGDEGQRGGRPAGRLRVGIVDRPEAQAQEPLELDLRRGGGWLAVGGPRSGRTTFLQTVLAETVALSPADVHVHVLDHGGGALAAVAAGLPHTGTAVGADDPLRTVRLLDRLAQEVAARRTGTDAEPAPKVVLLVDGLESVSAQLDDADPSRGSAALLRLVRDGAAAGLTCLLTADRAVPGGRVAGAVSTRLVLPLADRADYATAGLAPRAVPDHRPPGRALLGEAGVECQLALPRPLPPASSWAGVVVRPRPLSIPELPAAPVLPLSHQDTAGPGLRLPIGPGGDEGTVLEVELSRTGGLLAAGGPGSGRRTALAAFARHLSTAGVPVLEVTGGLPPTAEPEARWTRVSGADHDGWRAWRAALDGSPGVVLVSDHGAVADSPVLAALGTGEASEGLVLLVGGTAGELASGYRGPVMALRRRRSGLLLCPGPGDADLLGIRLPRTPVPQRPGSGWLVTAGIAQRVQVARRAPAGAGGPRTGSAEAAG